jgi:hypothetical protein
MNIADIFVTAPTFQLLILELPALLNTIAPLNIPDMFVTLDVFHPPMFLLNNNAELNILLMFTANKVFMFQVFISAVLSPLLNLDAALNIPEKVVTLFTFHGVVPFPSLELNELQLKNIDDISIQRDVSQGN